MRKHFLLLFLMTLIPFYGWAEDLTGNSGVIVAVADIEYGQAAHAAADIRVTLDGGEISDTYWDNDGYYDNEACEGDPITLSTLSVGDTRYVKIKFKGAYSGYAVGSFKVKPCKITVSVKADDANYFTMVYKGARPNAVTPLDEDDVTAKKGESAVTLSDYVVVDEEKLNAYTFSGKTVATSGSQIYFPEGTFTLKPDKVGNYEIGQTVYTMTITPAKITTGVSSPFTITPTWNYNSKSVPTAPENDQYMYSTGTHKPTYAITWDEDDDDTNDDIELTANDFEIKIYDSGSNLVAEPKDAGTYTVKVLGKGNFKAGDDPNDELTLGTYDIEKAPMTIMALPKSRAYNGDPYVVGEAQFNVAGRVGTDVSKSVTGLAAKDVDEFAAGKGSYTVDVVTTSAKIGGVALNKNYDISTTEVEWVITKAALTVKANNVTMVKGDDYPLLNEVTDPVTEWFTVEGAVNATELATITSNYEVAYANADGEPLHGILYNALQVKTYNNAIKLTQTDNAVFNNYEVTEKKANLIVNGAPFTIMPVVASDIQYGDKYEIAYYTDGTIDDSKLVFVIGETEYAWKDRKTWALPTARNNYNVTIKDGTAVGKEGSLGGVPTLLSSSYNIVKKQLHLTVKDQTVYQNNVAADFLDGLANAAEVQYTLAPGEKLVGDEKLTLTYSLDPEVVKIDEDGKITGYQAGKTAADASIKVVLGTDAESANYDITGYILGKLTIDPALKLDLAAATAEADIATAAANGSKFDVTISGRTLNANVWNVMVLPFTVKTFDFCKTIGCYAIFDVLSSANADSNTLRFALELDELPANTPFLVKPQAAVDFDQLNNHGTPADPADDYKDIIFEDVIFDNPNGNPVAEVDDVRFEGTYKDKITVEGGEKIQFLSGGKFYKATKDGVAYDIDIKFTRAYLDLTKSKLTPTARILVEEADGSTTAISSINADGVAVAADGWYTLNGVKLQSAPTEKGIYINNGKKVVIK